MAHFTFVIPSNKEELLNDSDSYCVKNLIDHENDLVAQMKVVKNYLRDEGAEFILENFDTYYSVLYLEQKLQMVNIFGAYTDLHKAMSSLNESIGFILEDKTSLENEELKTKYLNIIKMLSYVYVQTVLLIETKNEIQSKSTNLLRGKKTKKNQTDSQLELNKKAIIVVLNSLVQWELSLFFDPPVVEQSLLNLVAEVCYKFLSNPLVKSEKELRKEMFSFLGTLIKNYNHGNTFCIRMIQMVKTNDYLVEVLVEGVEQLVGTYNCRSLVHDLIKEIFEWVMEDQYDNQGSNRCGQVLTGMAVSMPDLMYTEFLQKSEFFEASFLEDSLRKAIIPMITEVLLKVLTKHDLTEQEKKSRDELLNILLDHVDDKSWVVRLKSIQQWARLQEEAAIPTKFVKQVLERIILHLKDVTGTVRKSAASCVTTFLSHNTFSANLSLESLQEKMRLKEMHPSIIKYNLIIRSRVAQAEEQWRNYEPELKQIVEAEFNQENDDEEEEEENEEEIPPGVEEIIQLYLKEKKLKDAVKLFLKVAESYDEYQELPEGEEGVEKILQMLMIMFLSSEGPESQAATGADKDNQITQEDIRMHEELEFLRDAVEFLKLIDSAIPIMVELLETTSIEDMKEATKFLKTACHFNLDNAALGVPAMMKMMRRNEQERRNVIIATFKEIYLMTDAKDRIEHAETIVRRLIRLLRGLSFDDEPHLAELIAEWVSNQSLGNDVIDMLWQFYTKRVDGVTDDEALACSELLTMCAFGRKTIITKNFKVVTTIAFQERKHDMAFLASACKFLSAGHERVEVSAEQCPFKIKYGDPIFKELFDILLEKFFEPVPFFGGVIMAAIQFVYKLCNTPDRFCEDLVKKIMKQLDEKYVDKESDGSFNCEKYILVRICQLLAAIPIQLLDFLDETIYKELKRRDNIRCDKKNKKSNKKGQKSVAITPRMRATANNTTNTPVNNSTVTDSTAAEESTLEGAQAQDDDAEFILSVLENNIVGGAGGLAKFFPLIKKICEMPDVYDDVDVQATAVVALMRFMLISSVLCESNIRLLFTIFEKTAFNEVKVNILVHLSDLLERFPNIIDPWTPMIFKRLKDPAPEIRQRSFFIVSTLILRDMIRAHSYLSVMANFLVDDSEELSDMCKTFFRTLAKKENNLYNALPDIFCYLMGCPEMTDDHVQEIMRFLFELMDKTKHMENLVDRFCSKFSVTTDIRQHKHITYCLTLITYNDKALKKLHENFSCYKHLMHDPDIHAHFKQILTVCGRQQKGNLKPLVDEMMTSIKAVFELSEDGQLMRPPPVPKPTKTPARNRKTKKRRYEDEDDE